MKILCAKCAKPKGVVRAFELTTLATMTCVEVEQDCLFSLQHISILVKLLLDRFQTSFLKNFLKDVSPFRGAINTSVLDFWWRLPWVSKPGWISHLHAFLPCEYLYLLPTLLIFCVKCCYSCNSSLEQSGHFYVNFHHVENFYVVIK